MAQELAAVKNILLYSPVVFSMAFGYTSCLFEHMWSVFFCGGTNPLEHPPIRTEIEPLNWDFKKCLKTFLFDIAFNL